MPIFHGLQGILLPKAGLWEPLVVEPDIAERCRFPIFSRLEVVALKHLLDPAIEALDHSVGLGRGQAMIDLEVGAKLVNLMRARCNTLAKAEEAVGELFSITPSE